MSVNKYTVTVILALTVLFIIFCNAYGQATQEGVRFQDMQLPTLED